MTAADCCYLPCPRPAPASHLPCKRHHVRGRLIVAGLPSEVADAAVDGAPTRVALGWDAPIVDRDGIPTGVTRYRVPITFTLDLDEETAP